MMRVVLLRRQTAPTDEIYLRSPLAKYARNGEIRIETVDQVGAGARHRSTLLLAGCHVVVSRYCPARLLRIIHRERSQLAGLYYLVDDDIAAASKTTALPLPYRLWQSYVARREFRALIGEADRVITTSRYLCRHYASERTQLLEPTCIWKPKALDHFEAPASIHVCFHATVAHSADLVHIAPVLAAIHDSRPRVRIELVTSARVPRFLANRPRVSHRRTMPWPEYRRFVSSSRRHIMLVPTLDTPFNRGKSHVKLFDATGLGAVGIYSNRAPYTDVIQQGVGGLLVNDDPASWYQALVALIDNLEDAKRMAATAQAFSAKIGNAELAAQFWLSLFRAVECQPA